MRERLVAHLAEHGGFNDSLHYLYTALFHAFDGHPEEVDSRVRRSELAATDPAARVFELGFSCYVLGIGGLGPEAAQCIRAAGNQPAYLLDFYDPWMPHFDPLRKSPEYKALMAELEARYAPVTLASE